MKCAGAAPWLMSPDSRGAKKNNSRRSGGVGGGGDGSNSTSIITTPPTRHQHHLPATYACHISLSLTGANLNIHLARIELATFSVLS